MSKQNRNGLSHYKLMLQTRATEVEGYDWLVVGDQLGTVQEIEIWPY